MSLESPSAAFPPRFRALVIGATGGIGGAMVANLRANPDCELVIGLHRQSQPGIDFNDPGSIGAAALAIQDSGPFHLIVNAAGLLHTPKFMPEKKLADLGYDQMVATFTANTFGPALVLAHFSKLLHPQGGVMAMLSAKVGSIEDNRLGGWYSYRASKAALNMLVKTAAIELKRTQPYTTLVALHPGTVQSELSKPFRGLEIGRAPSSAAGELLSVLGRLGPADSGRFLAYDGVQLPW